MREHIFGQGDEKGIVKLAEDVREFGEVEKVIKIQ